MIYLYLIIMTNGGKEILRTPHPSYASCLVALDHAKHPTVPEDSRTVVMFCGDDRMEWGYAGEWHRYQVSK